MNPAQGYIICMFLYYLYPVSENFLKCKKWYLFRFEPRATDLRSRNPISRGSCGDVLNQPISLDIVFVSERLLVEIKPQLFFSLEPFL